MRCVFFFASRQREKWVYSMHVETSWHSGASAQRSSEAKNRFQKTERIRAKRGGLTRSVEASDLFEGQFLRICRSTSTLPRTTPRKGGGIVRAEASVRNTRQEREDGPEESADVPTRSAMRIKADRVWK